MRYEIKEKPSAWVICQVRSNGATIKEVLSLPFGNAKERLEQFVKAQHAKKGARFECPVGLS